MALLFQRIAHNLAKQGFYPTDEDTTQRILHALSAPQPGELRILDPCCGKGDALATVQRHLGPERTRTYGIEIDEARAWKSKRVLERVIHGDLQDCVLGQRQYSCALLNPPYGNTVSDREQTGESGQTKRLEQLFFDRTVPALQYEGVLVLIVPQARLDKALSAAIARNFTRVAVYRTAVDRFHQVVVFGVRTRQAQVTDAKQTREHLRAIGVGKAGSVPLLPTQAWEDPYPVPVAPKDDTAKLVCLDIGARQLAEETRHFPCLWERFDTLFGHSGQVPRRPLCALSSWHLALVLAAGQVSGMVRAGDGRVFVVKGDTHKEKSERTYIEDCGEDEVRRVTEKLDRFVPVIRGLDLTPGSPTLGETWTIR